MTISPWQPERRRNSQQEPLQVETDLLLRGRGRKSERIHFHTLTTHLFPCSDSVVSPSTGTPTVFETKRTSWTLPEGLPRRNVLWQLNRVLDDVVERKEDLDLDVNSWSSGVFYSIFTLGPPRHDVRFCWYTVRVMYVYVVPFCSPLLKIHPP